MRTRWRIRVAALGVVVAAALAGGAALRAARIQPVSAGAVLTAADSPDSPDAHRRAATSPANIEAAAERNPFHPERRRGGVFRLPGTGPEAEPAGRPRGNRGVVGPVRLVGTAVAADGGDFVVCAVGREAPRIVRPGGKCGELVLEAVDRGRAEFTDPAGERVVLEVPKVGSR